MISETKPKDSPEVRKIKGAMLMKFIELLGEKDTPKYMKFIDKNYELGEEKIIDLWFKQ